MKEIPAATAWHNLNTSNENSRWKSFVRKTQDGVVFPHHEASFTISPDDGVFCIGSCFAKNIEKKLLGYGYKVLSHPDFFDESENLAPLPNVFNPFSILNEIRWGLTPWEKKPETAFVSDSQGFMYDPHATVDQFRGQPEVVRNRREGVTNNMRRIRNCRIIIITLGLVEVWYDKTTDMFLNATLPQFLLEREPGRYVLRTLDYTDCMQALLDIWQYLKANGHPDTHLFVSVSPVPLVATFGSNDVLVANSYSKSTLVAAAQDFAAREDNIHYIASHESVMYSPRHFVWQGDLRHVREEMVACVTNMFVRQQTVAERIGETVSTSIATDWPAAQEEMIVVAGLPKLFSATPGNKDFPAGFPKVTSSSSMNSGYDASCLMSASKRIWHSQSPPNYPEWLEFSFEQPLAVCTFYAQTQDAHPDRAPSGMRLDAWSGNSWETILAIDETVWEYGGEWKHWKVDRDISASKFRLWIFSNAGAENLLTIQNVYLKPAIEGEHEGA